MEPVNLSGADLKGERQRLQYLLTVSPAIIYTTQASGDGYLCTFVSENLRAIMGYAPEEMTTDPKCWPERLHPEDAPRVLADLVPLIEQGGGTVAYRFRHRDGHYIWIQDSFKVVRDEAGKPLELVGAWADISELRDTRQRLQSLLAVSPAIIYTTQSTGDGYACSFVSENLRAIMGYAPEEMTTDPKCWPERLHPEDAPRVLADLVPLIEQGGGTVAYRFRHRDGHYLWIQDTFKVIRDEAGKPLELVGAWADISELKGARQRLEYLLAVSPAIIYTTKATGDFACTFISENLQGMLGYSPQEMTTDPKCWPELLHPDDAARTFAEMQPLIDQGGGTVTYRFRHRDGHYIWIQDTFKVIRDEAGQPLELVGAWADITERKNAEQAALRANAEIQETKRYLSRLLEASTDAIFSTDKAENIVLFNQGAETLLGYHAEEVIGRRVSVLYGSEEGAREVVRELRKRGGTASAFENTLRAKDGKDVPVLISASVLFDDEAQEIGTVAFATDLRERKHAEEALHNAREELEERVEARTAELRSARERLQYVMAIAPGIMYTNQAKGEFKCTFVSENVDPIMGFSAWEMLEDPKFWPSRLHPEDAPRVFGEVERFLAEGGGTVEYRFRHRNGNYLWFQDTFRVIRDASGNAEEVVGAWADISDRKRAEQALGERLAIMKDLQSLVAASPSVIYTTQVSGDFACTFVSENLQAIMGYAPWEMRDDPQFWVKHLYPEDAERVFAELEKLIGLGGGTVEYRFRHRLGHYLWVQDTFTVTYDNDGKPKELVGSWADISDRKRAEVELERLAKEVELRNRFIRETFGRYLTDEVVATVLETPTGLQVGGEKRKVTMMMTDLRGFTSLSERLPPERVVAILNRYLAAMVKIIKNYGGTIDEYIGDAIFVLFGAPIWREDDAQRAVACAVTMQLAMDEVNEQNRAEDLPEVEMGIGIHTGQVVLGNIGSPERMKYGVVGRHVNLTSRIQSYSTGGQILITEATRREAGSMVKIGKQLTVKAKGIEHPVTVSEVLGIAGRHKLFLSQGADVLVPLGQEIAVRFAIVEGAQLGEELFDGRITKLSPKRADVRLTQPLPPYSNVKIHVFRADGQDVPGALYGKVVGTSAGSTDASISFTSMSPEIDAFFRTFLPKPSAEPGPAEPSEAPRAAPRPSFPPLPTAVVEAKKTPAPPPTPSPETSKATEWMKSTREAFQAASVAAEAENGAAAPPVAEAQGQPESAGEPSAAAIETSGASSSTTTTASEETTQTSSQKKKKSWLRALHLQ